MNFLSVALLLLTVASLTTSAILAFWWAGGDGQFQEMERAAMSVFDADEAGEVETPNYYQHEHH